MLPRKTAEREPGRRSRPSGPSSRRARAPWRSRRREGSRRGSWRGRRRGRGAPPRRATLRGRVRGSGRGATARARGGRASRSTGRPRKTLPSLFPCQTLQDQLAGTRGVDPVRRERVEARDEVGRVGGGRKLAEAADPHPVEPGFVHVPDSRHGEGERLPDERREVDEDPVPADSLAPGLVRQRIGRPEIEAVDPRDPVGRFAVGRPPAGGEDERAVPRGPAGIAPAGGAGAASTAPAASVSAAATARRTRTARRARRAGLVIVRRPRARGASASPSPRPARRGRRRGGSTCRRRARTAAPPGSGRRACRAGRRRPPATSRSPGSCPCRAGRSP